jgi:hypothetical protein
VRHRNVHCYRYELVSALTPPGTPVGLEVYTSKSQTPRGSPPPTPEIPSLLLPPAFHPASTCLDSIRPRRSAHRRDRPNRLNQRPTISPESRYQPHQLPLRGATRQPLPRIPHSPASPHFYPTPARYKIWFSTESHCLRCDDF